MNDLISKISSYEIFNNIIPGAVFAFLLEALSIFHFETTSIITDVVLYYFLGLIVSRIGSLIIDPALQLSGIIEKADYSAFIRASAKDEKILVLLEFRNLLRTVFSLLIVTLAAYLWVILTPSFQLSSTTKNILVLSSLALLFLLSYRKQNRFITKRVEHHKDL